MAEAPDREGSVRVRRRWLRWLALGAGVLVVGLLLHALGTGHIAAYLRRVGPGFALLPLCYLLATLLYSLPLGVFLDGDEGDGAMTARPRLGPLLSGRIAAISVNSSTPLLGLGGEPVRLLWLPRAVRRRAVAALFVDRGAYLLASALFLVSGTLVAVGRLQLPRVALVAMVAVALATLVGAGLLWWMQRRGSVAGPLARLAATFARHHRERLATLASEVDGRLRALHAGPPRRFTAAVSLHLGGRLLMVAEMAAGAWLLGLHVGLGGALVLTALPLAVDFAFAVVPSQIGLHEGATALLAGGLGLDPAAGVALAFLLRLRQVLFVAAGFALLALVRHAPEARQRGEA